MVRLIRICSCEQNKRGAKMCIWHSGTFCLINHNVIYVWLLRTCSWGWKSPYVHIHAREENIFNTRAQSVVPICVQHCLINSNDYFNVHKWVCTAVGVRGESSHLFMGVNPKCHRRKRGKKSGPSFPQRSEECFYYSCCCIMKCRWKIMNYYRFPKKFPAAAAELQHMCIARN